MGLSEEYYPSPMFFSSVDWLALVVEIALVVCLLDLVGAAMVWLGVVDVP